MTDKHTPGPWRQVRHTIWAGPPNTTNGPIAEASGSTVEEGEANARLIAAAPELLKALEELKAVLMRGLLPRGYKINTTQANVAVEKARAAIKAAKGDA